MNIQDYIRGNNRFWLGLYYDVLIDEPCYQLTYCSQANEPYLNCVQAVSEVPEFSVIESYYQSRNLPSAFYTDIQSEKWLVPLLTSKQYHEILSQNENIWCLTLNSTNTDCLCREIFSDCEQKELRQVCTLNDLKLFTRINALTNELPPPLAQSLFNKLKDIRVEGVDSKHFIIYLARQPAGCGSIGIYKDIAYLAEDGTLLAYRRRGLHCYSMQQRILYAHKRGARCVLTTCSTNSITNISAKKIGMNLLCTRRFFQKTPLTEM